MLPFALHGYRATVRSSTGATPFSLVYGMEAVLPLEVEIPSLRVIMEAKLSEAEWCQGRYDQLNLVEEKRLDALARGRLYQTRMKTAFDKKVRPREFKEGKLVLKRRISQQPDPRGKWTPNYEGPYVVKKAFFACLDSYTHGWCRASKPCECRYGQEILCLDIWKEQRGRSKTRKGGLGKNAFPDGSKTRKGDPGKIRDKKNDEYERARWDYV